MKKEADRLGVVNVVRHVPPPGTDKSPHTTNWSTGLPEGVDGRPMSMLSSEEQEMRRAAWHRE